MAAAVSPEPGKEEAENVTRLRVEGASPEEEAGKRTVVMMV